MYARLSLSLSSLISSSPLQAVVVVNGTLSQVSTITAVTASIIDIDNFPPSFQYLNYAANVTEGMPLGATVPALTIVCTDPDVVSRFRF